MANASPSALTAAEKKIIAAAKTGEMATFGEKRKPKIRAKVLQRLICGVPQAGRKTADPVLPTGLKIRNARITGKLDLAGWPGRADDPALPLPGLHFENCVFDEPVLISQSRFSYLRFWLCKLKAIFGADARIDGPVELNGSTCTGAEHPLYGDKCALDLDGAVIADGLKLSIYDNRRFAALGKVRFVGAQIGGSFSANGANLKNENGDCLSFDRAVIKGSVFFRVADGHRFEACGKVHFISAHIEGSIVANGAIFNNEGETCLSFDRTEIKGGLFLRMADDYRYESKGEVRFLGAQIGGSFAANGASFQNKGKTCLSFDRAVIKGDVLLRMAGHYRSEMNGKISFPGTQIFGKFEATGILVENEDQTALIAEGAKIGASVVFRPPQKDDPGYSKLIQAHMKQPPKIMGRIDFRNSMINVWVARDCDFTGPMDMRGAHIGRLVDNPETGWPKENGRLLLDGLVYDALEVARDGEADKTDLANRRLKWLRLQFKNPKHPASDEFRPQPFMQLAKTLRAQGHDKEGDEVAIALRQLQMRTVEERWFMRQILRFLNLTSDFGYSGLKAVLSLLIWLAIGTTMYGAHAFAGNFGPADEVALGRHDTKADSLVYWLPPSAPAHEKWRKTVRGCPGLVSPVYALDVMLPLIGLGQRRLCAFDPQGPAAPLWRFWHAFYAIMGAILSAIAILTLTGLLRKE